MIDEGDGNGTADRRRHDRRRTERGVPPRGMPERRRGDRRARNANAVLLMFLAFGRLAGRAHADPAPRQAMVMNSEPLLSKPLPGLLDAAPRRRGPSAYRPFIDHSASTHGVSAALVEAVIRVESQFNPLAVSHKGAQGLMQLMPDTARRFGVKNSFDPQQNIAGGTRYLAWLLRQFSGDVELACAAYNAGEKVVLRYGGIPPYKETRDYVRKINRLLGRASSDPGPAPTPRRESVFYTWRDERGILNVSQFPPRNGQKYETRRMR
jgi:soluble lytic murein transglycosylase-like protein